MTFLQRTVYLLAKAHWQDEEQSNHDTPSAAGLQRNREVNEVASLSK